MKNILFILLLTICAHATYAQTWLANDHQWTYSVLNGLTLATGKCLQYIVKDTVVQGQNCKQVHLNCDPSFTPLRYAYAEDNKVFAWRPSSGGEWIKIYDFNLQVGDTMEIPDAFIPTKYKITKVDEVYIGQQWVKRQQWAQLNNNNNGTNIYDILEGIGNVGILGSPTPQCSRFLMNEHPCTSSSDGPDYKFICFSSNNNNYTPYEGCTVSAAEPKTDLKNEVAVHPNPANDHLTVRTALNNPIRRVQLYDVQGALQLEVQPAETATVDVDTAQLPAGMYMLLVHSAEGQYAQLVILEKT